MFYMTGFFPSSSAVLLLQPEPHLFISKMDAVVAESAGVDFTVLENFEKELKLEASTVAVEKKYTSLDFYEKFLKGKKLLDMDFIEKMRLVKEKKETEEIKRALDIARSAIKGIVYRGLSEREAAASLEYEIKRKADVAFEAIVASGENSAIPHHLPADRIIGEGDTVIVDAGARFNHYNSDVTRTFTDSKIYETVLRAQKAGIEECYAGNDIKNVDIAVRKVLKKEGLEDFFLHSSGHGIGLEVHEPPRLSSDENGKFKKGMVVTVEPGVYKKYGIRVEDMILIRKNPKVLGR
ncbi:MAG: M24 family metallopeptidase [Candidatus Hydrothermarchaeaceae archaeon]